MENRTPLVSVIIPCYNAEKYLVRCLDSIVGQTYENLEIIVVNDGSKGNVEQIFDDYHELYPNFYWKLVIHEKNRGLFRARISGYEVSHGEYISFVDADDHISCDFYRLLVNRAIITGADMTACEIVYENTKGEMWQYPLMLLQMTEGQVEEKDLLDFFYRNEGKCCSLQIIWNKLYRRDLYERVYPHLNSIQDHIIMLEDYLASNALFAEAHSLVVTKRAYYYYYKGEEASTSLSLPLERIEKNINDLGLVFKRAKSMLENLGRYSEVEEHFQGFMKLYYRIWKRKILHLKLGELDKRKLQRSLGIQLPINDEEVQPIDEYHFSVSSPFSDSLEKMKSILKLSNVRYISFDIFDTLVVRPFIYPTDLFHLLDDSFSEAMGNTTATFEELRVRAEKEARIALAQSKSTYEDITLDEIYKELIHCFHIPANIAETMKQKEIALEMQFCLPRQVGKELYDLAKEAGKQVLFISDMYLDRRSIEEILVKNGYSGSDPLFLSSECRVTKASGEMYRLVKRKLNLHNGEWIHIGDNYQSDVENAKQNGCQAYHLPRAVNVMTGEFGHIYSGEFFKTAFYQKGINVRGSALEFLGIRCMMALIANHLFDNPFVEWNQSSWLNALPYTIGYAALGPELWGIAHWLRKESKDYDKIHFIARDGYLVRQVFNILFPEVKTDYLRVSRKALMPLDVSQILDFPKLRTQFNWGRYSPGKVIRLLEPILPETFDKREFCEKNHWIEEKHFHTIEEVDDFLSAIGGEILQDRRGVTFRESMKRYFSKLIHVGECTFDSGYSGRTERILTRLLGFPIDAFYVHLNDDKGLVSSQRYGFHIHTFFSNTPTIRGVIRELLLSETGPSCIGYQRDEKGQMYPKFEEHETECPQEFIMKQIHKGALDFIRDFYSCFGEKGEQLPLRFSDTVLPLETFLYSAPDIDRRVLKAFDFEDDIGVGRINVYDFWNQQTARQGFGDGIQMNGIAWNWLPKWKKVIMYAMLDRRELKIRIKERYRCNPLYLGIMAVTYKSLRKVYHLFR